MNLRQPAGSLREFYDFDAKFAGLDRYVMWPSIRLVVSKSLLLQAVASAPQAFLRPVKMIQSGDW